MFRNIYLSLLEYEYGWYFCTRNLYFSQSEVRRKYSLKEFDNMTKYI